MSLKPLPPVAGRFFRHGRRSAASLVAAVLVTGGGIYLALRGVEFEAVGRSFGSSEYWTLAPALGLLGLAICARVVRWRLLFAVDTRPPVRPAAEALLIGHFFNNVLPARAGDVIRVVALHTRARTSRAETLATIVVERTFDTVALLMLFLLALPWLPSVSWLRAAAWVALGLSLGVVVVGVALARYGRRPLRLLLRPLAMLAFVSVERVDHGAASLVRGFAALRQGRLAVASFALTIASWLLLATSFWLVAIGFAPELSPLAGILIAVATGLAFMLPAAPAALGVFEGAVVVALIAYGVPRADALSAALVLHAVNFFPFLAAGGAVLLLSSRRAPLGGLRRLAGDGPEREAERQLEPVEAAQDRDEPIVRGERPAGDLRATEKATRH